MVRGGLLLACCGAGLALAGDRVNITGSQRIMTAHEADQSGPAISGDRIVFVDRRNGNADIFSLKATTGAQEPLASGAHDQMQPDIDGRYVVYTDFGPATGGGDIMVLALPQADPALAGWGPRPLAADPGSAETDPAIDGMLVVWAGGRDGNREIFVGDVFGGPARRVTLTPLDESDPAISGHRVVYVRRFGPDDCQIMLTDLASGETRQVSDGAACFGSPDIDGDRVVYDGQPGDTQDVFVHDLTTGGTLRIVLAGIQRNAHVSGDWLSAEKVAMVPFTQVETKIFNIPNEFPFEAIRTLANEEAGDIDGWRVAYQTDERGNWDIGLYEFTANIGGNTSPRADAGPDRIVECAGAAGTPVTLDGSRSGDPDGDPIDYAWTGPFLEDGGTAGGAEPTVTLPLGPSRLRLAVSDGHLTSPADSAIIQVMARAEGMQEPLAGMVPGGETPAMPAREFKRGSVLPLRLRLFCGEEPLGLGAMAPEIVALEGDAGAIDLFATDTDAGRANDGSRRFRFGEGAWIYNLSTRALPAGRYTLTLRLPDGQRLRAAFALR